MNRAYSILLACTACLVLPASARADDVTWSGYPWTPVTKGLEPVVPGGGTLVYTLTPGHTASWDARFPSSCTFEGDFHVSVDYDLVTWVDDGANHTRVALVVNDPPDVGVITAERTRIGDADSLRPGNYYIANDVAHGGALDWHVVADPL